MCVQNFTYMYISFHFPQRCHMWFTLPLCVSLQKSDQIFDLLPLAVLDWNSLSPLLSLVYSVCLSVCLSNCLFLSLFSPFFTIYHLLFVTDILSLSLITFLPLTTGCTLWLPHLYCWSSWQLPCLLCMSSRLLLWQPQSPDSPHWFLLPTQEKINIDLSNTFFDCS